MYDKVQLFVQLNPRVRELRSFLADVRTEVAGDGVSETRVIGPIAHRHRYLDGAGGVSRGQV